MPILPRRTAEHITSSMARYIPLAINAQSIGVSFAEKVKAWELHVPFPAPSVSPICSSSPFGKRKKNPMLSVLLSYKMLGNEYRERSPVTCAHSIKHSKSPVPTFGFLGAINANNNNKQASSYNKATYYYFVRK